MKTKRFFKLILISIGMISTAQLSYAQAPGWQWAKSAGGTSSDEGLSVATDANGNVYVTGYFTSPSITFGADTLTNAGDYDIFVAKLGAYPAGIAKYHFTDNTKFFPNPFSSQAIMQTKQPLKNATLTV